MISEQIGVAHVGLQHRILNIDAPPRAALVRNPARKECAPKSGLSPIPY
jgi:hypothetical protein